MGREHDGSPVNRDTHPATAVADLVRKALGDRRSTLRTEEAEFSGGGGPGQVNGDGVVGPTALEDWLSGCAARVISDELHLRAGSSTARTAVVRDA